MALRTLDQRSGIKSSGIESSERHSPSLEAQQDGPEAKSGVRRKPVPSKLEDVALRPLAQLNSDSGHYSPSLDAQQDGSEIKSGPQTLDAGP